MDDLKTHIEVDVRTKKVLSRAGEQDTGMFKEIN